MKTSSGEKRCILSSVLKRQGVSPRSAARKWCREIKHSFSIGGMLFPSVFPEPAGASGTEWVL